VIEGSDTYTEGSNGSTEWNTWQIYFGTSSSWLWEKRSKHMALIQFMNFN